MTLFVWRFSTSGLISELETQLQPQHTISSSLHPLLYLCGPLYLVNRHLDQVEYSPTPSKPRAKRANCARHATPKASRVNNKTQFRRSYNKPGRWLVATQILLVIKFLFQQKNDMARMGSICLQVRTFASDTHVDICIIVYNRGTYHGKSKGGGGQ